MLCTFDALIVTPMRGSFLPRSYRSIHQPRGGILRCAPVAVCLYAGRYGQYTPRQCIPAHFPSAAGQLGYD